VAAAAQRAAVDPALDGLRFEELRERLEAAGMSPAHALPVFQRLHDGGGRRRLEPRVERWMEGAERTRCEVARDTASADGWTRKYLLRLADGAEVESVLMGFPGRRTACLSTQVGCAMGCVFCATGRMGFRRHLKAGEIVAQARLIDAESRRLHGERVRNLVMMGMGEPLHNFDETVRALDILSDTRGTNVGPGRISISTVGHVPGIRKLARHPRGYSLAVSLHGASDEERGALIPVNRRWPLAELLDACREFSQLRGQRVFIAWTLIGGVNDDLERARRLAGLLRGMDVHVNLIPLNPTEGYEGREPEWERVLAFQAVLREAGMPATVRQKRGIDVDAGCGQLAVGA